MICNICNKNIVPSKLKEHVSSDCQDPSDNKEFLRIYQKGTGVRTFNGSFRPSPERLIMIAEKAQDRVLIATPEDLEDWTE